MLFIASSISDFNASVSVVLARGSAGACGGVSFIHNEITFSQTITNKPKIGCQLSPYLTGDDI